MGKDLVKTYITPEFQASVSTVLSNALDGVQTDNYEFPLYTKTGERVEVLLNATTRRDATGAIVGVVGVGQDITAMKTVQAEQERVAAELSLLIDTANAPIFGVDSEGRVTVWNRKAAQITGYSTEDTMGKNLVESFIREENRASVTMVLQQALEGKPLAPGAIYLRRLVAEDEELAAALVQSFATSLEHTGKVDSDAFNTGGLSPDALAAGL